MPDPALPERALRRPPDERDLRRGVELGEFEPHYQPIIDLHEGRIVGVEVLPRWRHPTRGLLGPAAFVERATACGLIGGLRESIARAALSDAGAWPAAIDIELAINVAARQLDDDGFASCLQQAVAETRFDARRLVLEVVEEDLTAVTGAGASLDRLGELARVRVYVDDFGTRPSSLARLHALPIDGVKIDPRVVARVTTDPRDRAIVEAVVTLASALELTVIAKGIVGAQQRDAVCALGCRLGQGWYYSPALGAGTLNRLLTRTAAGEASPQPCA